MDPEETVAVMAVMDEARRQVGVRYAADDDPAGATTD